MVCYRVIVAPYVRSVGHVFAYPYTLDDDSERTMDYETSLLLKVFPSLRHCLRVNGTEPEVDTLDGALKVIYLQI